MKFKEVRYVKLSLYPSIKKARWKSVETIASDIIIYLHYCNGKSPEYIFNYIVKSFLGEYICSCVFRGNRFKKECTDRKPKKLPKIGCIPFVITDRMLRELWDLPSMPICNRGVEQAPNGTQKLLTSY